MKINGSKSQTNKKKLAIINLWIKKLKLKAIKMTKISKNGNI